MSRELTYAEQVAPYPDSNDPDVAEKLARYLATMVQGDVAHTAGHYYMSAPVGDKQAARDYALVIGRMVGNFGTLSLLRTLIAADPDLANKAARKLVDAWDAGEAVGEWTWQWLVEYGIDAEKVGAEIKPFERIEVAA